MAVTYQSDRQIIEALLPIRLFAVVIAEGMEDPDGNDALTLMTWLRQAQDEILAGLTPKKAEAVLRRAGRAAGIAKRPFVEANAAVAKFGLCVFYLLDCLRRNRVFGLIDDSAFDKAVSAVLAPDGTVTELANIPKVDSSAQKQAKHMLEALKGEGYFQGVDWE